MINYWTNEEYVVLKSLYFNTPVKIIGKILNRTSRSITVKANRLKLKNPNKSLYQHDFFKVWSPEMAYILGFTTADGYVYHKGVDTHILEYGIKDIDREILEFIRSCLCPNKIIHQKNCITKNTLCYGIRLSLNSKKMVKDLEQYNVIQNKTGKEKLPKIPEQYKSYYLRGLFDGDGCIYHNKKYNLLSFKIISASYSFLVDIQKELGSEYGHINKNGTAFNWIINKKAHIRDIYNFMYQDLNVFYLKRKYNIFKEFYNQNEEVNDGINN
jgi:intein/homing endonuclease